MAQYSKVRVLKLVEDVAQAYDDAGNPIPGQKTKRIRAQVLPVKPDPIFINLTKADESIITKFRAIEGQEHAIVFPSRVGVTDQGISFTSLVSDCSVDDIDIIPAKRPVAGPVAAAASSNK